VYVAGETWFGVACPLTTWEARLRGGTPSGLKAGFIAYWVHRLLFYALPPWAFEIAYTLFGAAVVAVFWRVPPRWR